jgi:hypothetical protein
MNNLTRAILVFGLSIVAGLAFVGLIQITPLLINVRRDKLPGAMFAAMTFWVLFGAVYAVVFYRRISRR